MTIVHPTNSKVDSNTGKSTNNFVGSPEQIQHYKQVLNKCKEQVTKHFNSVYDTSAEGNLPSKVCLEHKKNATPYQAQYIDFLKYYISLSRVNWINM